MKFLKDFINNLKRVFVENPTLLKKYLFAFFVSMFLVAILTKYLESQESKPEEITYTEFEDLVEQDKVDIVKYNVQNEYMFVYLTDEISKDMTLEDKKEYIYPIENTKTVLYPANDTFRKDLLENDVYVILMSNEYTIIDILSIAQRVR